MVRYETIVKIILVLLVIILGIQFLGGMKHSVDTIRRLIDRSILDRELMLIDRYANLQSADSEAINSNKAILYAINRLAWFDTYTTASWRWDEQVNIAEELGNNWYVRRSGAIVKGEAPEGYTSLGSYASFGRQYGDTKVIPTIMDTQLIYYTDTNKPDLVKKIVMKTIDCWTMFKEINGGQWSWQQENIRCFAAEFGSISNNIVITSGDLKKGFEDLKDDEDCDENCQKRLKDITGGSWLEFWNGVNWQFDVEGDKITNQNNRENNNIIRICGDKKGKNEIFITDRLDVCHTPADALIFTMIVRDFNYPDDVQNPQKWFGSKGDPKYILYYQKFPEGEDSAWEYNSIDLASVAVRAVEALLFKGLPKITTKIIPDKFFMRGSFVKDFTRAFEPGWGLFKSSVKYAAAGSIRRAPKYLIVTFIEQTAEAAIRADWKKVIDNFQNGISSITAGIKTDGSELENLHPEDFQIYLITKYSGELVFEKYYDIILEEFTEDKDKIKTLSSYRYSFKDIFSKKTDEFFEKKYEILSEQGFSQKFKLELLSDIKDHADDLGKFPEHLVESIENDMSMEIDEIFWFYDIAALANYELIYYFGQYEKNKDAVISEIENKIESNKEISSGVSGRERASFDRQKKTILNIMIEQQESNILLKRKFPDSDLNRLFEKISQDIELPRINVGETEGVSITRMIISHEIMLDEYKKASISEKYYAVGTNSFGMRTPYRMTLSYDDKWTRGFSWPKDVNKYLEFFEYYGGEWTSIDGGSETPEEYKKVHFTEKFFGMLPEVERYYMSMTRDKVWYWFAQKDIRLHLVSPCKADVLMRVTQCECYGVPNNKNPATARYETGRYNPDYDITIPHFDGENKMLYQVDTSTGQIVKNCEPKGITDYMSGTKAYTPLCIEFDPVMDSTQRVNYCYKGIKPAGVAVANIVFTWVIPPVVGGFAGPWGYFIAGVAGDILYAGIENAYAKWPNHGSTI